jgi:hypothetical protein
MKTSMPTGICLAARGIRLTARGICLAAGLLISSCSFLEPPAPPPPVVRAAPEADNLPSAIPVVQSPEPEPERVAVVPQVRPEPKPNLFDPKSLVGLDQIAVENMMGKPAAIQEEPPATIWQYTDYSGGDGCALKVYFYLDIGTHKLRALSYDINAPAESEHAADDNRLCVGRIQAENLGKQR